MWPVGIDLIREALSAIGQLRSAVPNLERGSIFERKLFLFFFKLAGQEIL